MISKNWYRGKEPPVTETHDIGQIKKRGKEEGADRRRINSTRRRRNHHPFLPPFLGPRSILLRARGTRRAETRSWNAYSSCWIFRTSGREERRTRFASNQRRFRFPVGPPRALLFQPGVPSQRARFINKDIDTCRQETRKTTAKTCIVLREKESDPCPLHYSGLSNSFAYFL